MKKKTIYWMQRIRLYWSKIQLKDKFLIIFMMILLAQTIFNLFVKIKIGTYSTNIDTVIRTTTASIFGYFLSANFLVKKVVRDKKGACSHSKKVCEEEPIRNSLEREAYLKLQILIAGVIGLVSLVILIIAHDIAATEITSLATLSQLRDFVSGCVGFLIGIPQDEEDDEDED